ncbi:hypothetical protein [Leadbettera azotonutricia]|uniref:Uncharacterized protein n=1 Tax=Leadbettera azotonutricia (strain ATCC BAA-888 / DSM 13862 / ZAS-9) TaxID=545695 RepID=F5YA10_LEAAZ|nr:hypothetical protein [Leadbettera azotonutricia]AEF80180.1 hypothetical protein TREAZ_2053 [Leadbettera azotonutricia ZAS-9]
MKDNANHYFLVCCKCGHVGKRRFIPLVFPIRARDRLEADARGRAHPGVKHDNRTAVLWIKAATVEEYRQARIELYKDVYWQCLERGSLLLADRIVREQQRPKKESSKKDTRQFRFKKSKVAEDEIRDYVIRKYRVAV